VEDAASAVEAKGIAEASQAYRDGDMVSGPDVVAVREVVS
jgi:hypothetical protein